MKLTYNIKPVLRKDKIKADDLIPIYLSVRVGPTATRAPSGKSTLQKDWNIKDSSPKGNSKQNLLLSAYLNQMMSEWRTYMLESEILGKPITLLMAKNFFKTDAKQTFYSFCEQAIEQWIETKEENTLKTYRTTLNALRKFSPKANFGDLDHGFVVKFDVFLSKVQGNGIGGKFTKHKCFKSFINEAYKYGLMPSEKHPYRHFKIKAAIGNRSFLSISELNMLVSAIIPEKEVMLQRVKDMYLFSCFTGLRFSDCQNLTWSSIKSDPDMIKLKMQKTAKEIAIPLGSNAKDILDKYGKLTIKAPKAPVFPKVANQVVNRNLKDLMKLSNIDRSMSFHTARHTFASNLIEANVNLIYVQKLLGHSRITDTQLYAQGLETNLFSSIETLQQRYQGN